MKKFYTVPLAVVLGIAIGYAQEVPTIYAYRTFQERFGDNSVCGVVSFKADNPSNLTLVADQTALGPVYGGTYYNYDWYAQITTKGTQSGVDGWYTINLKDGTRTLISREGAHVIDITYDYVDKTMYCVSHNNKSLVRLDPATGKTTTVAAFSQSQINMLCIAAALDGTLYGISTDDFLWKIDKKTAELTKVGSLEADAGFTQSMAFDHNTGVLYWANAANRVLYTVDTTTGKATAVGIIGEDSGDTVNSLVIEYIDAPKGSPDRVTDREAVTNGSSVSLSWTNPTTDVNGKPLSSITAVKVLRDGKDIATVTSTLSPGAKASYVDAGVAEGLHSYAIVAVNAAGQGGMDTRDLTVKVGADAPGAVVGLKADQGDLATILSWQAPAKGANGGQFDPSSITGYTVRRYKGKTASKFNVDPSSTTYTDKAAFGVYDYSVSATNAQGESPETFVEGILVKPANWIVNGYDHDFTVQPGIDYEFYDEGGANGPYVNSSTNTTILRAAEDGYITVDFATLSIENGYDNLFVYNGLPVEANLVGQFTGNVVDPKLKGLTSLNADKCLSFVLISDVMEAYDGWKANVKYVKMNETDLAATALNLPPYIKVGEEARAVVSIVNKGSKDVKSGTYSVVLRHDSKELARTKGIDLAGGKVADIEIPFTPAAEGEMAGVYATVELEGDQNPDDNKTPGVNVTVISKDSEVIRIGNNKASLAVAPASFYSQASIAETVYTTDLLPASAKGKNLTSLSYYYNAPQAVNGVDIEVYVGETDFTDLVDNCLTSADLTKVYAGKTSIASGDNEWAFKLDTPYPYTGKNLVVLVNKSGDGTGDMSVSFCGDYYYDIKSCTRFANNGMDPSTTKFDPAEAFGYDGVMRPDIKLVFSGNAGVDNITVDSDDNAPAVYYNLQGIRIDSDNMAPGVYIRRTGNTSTKVLVK